MPHVVAGLEDRVPVVIVQGCAIGKDIAHGTEPLDPSFLSEPDVVRLRLTQLAGQLKVRLVSRRGARNMHKGVAVDQLAQFDGVEIADGPAFEPDTELGVKRGHDAQVSSMG